MQQNVPFQLLNLHPLEGNPLKHRSRNREKSTNIKTFDGTPPLLDRDHPVDETEVNQEALDRDILKGDICSVGVSGYFLFFFCSGRGKGESEVQGGRGGVQFFIENPRRGGGGSPGREGPRGREGVCGKLGNFWGGAKYFFFQGRNVHQVWKWDFALKFALENGISLCNSHSTSQLSLLFLREFHREDVV